MCIEAAPSLCFALAGGSNDAVDIYDNAAAKWSTARLSQARFNLAATSLPAHGLAFFAGGESTF
jgi:hypothetical protein